MITLRTPSRIHITLIDLHRGLKRVDGGIGLALEEPFTEVSAKRSEELVVKGPFKERAYDAVKRMLSTFEIDGAAELDIAKSYEAHIGLGLGTQLVLAVGHAVSKLYNIDVSVREIAEIMGRGGTSGIGTAVFEQGGFILDGGHSTKEKSEFLPSSASNAGPAPILSRMEFPDWKMALVTPRGAKVHGKREVDIFQRHCPIPIEDVRMLSHLILMKTLPSVVERDITSFGESINDIQSIGFKKIEVSLQTQQVKDLLKRCQKHSYGAGLSSFGPTIYCIADDVDELTDAVGGEADVTTTKANNVGAAFLK